MRILALMTQAYGASGGIEKFNRDLLAGLVALPMIDRVDLLLRALPRDAVPALPKLHLSRLAPRGLTAFIAAALATRLRPCPDRVLCAHLNLLPVARRIARGAPIDLIIHGIDAWQPKRGFRARDVDRVFSVSRFTARRFQQWSGVSEACMRLLPNSVDIDRFATPPEPMTIVGVPDQARVIMTLARLDARERFKGIDEMFAALPRILAEIPDAHYLICGTGSDLPRLRQQAHRLGLDAHVSFTGFLAESLKVSYLHRADAFVLAGHAEGFGIVLLEALAAGLPVVASSLDGSQEAVRDGRLGAIVDPRDPVALSTAVLTALERGKRPPPADLMDFSIEAFDNRVADLFASSRPTRRPAFPYPR